uniref:Uncharacterized protein n=1 Tax=Meloidogyne hapla TaxID=6305 RepID=A0A1I8B5L8_MELHA
MGLCFWRVLLLLVTSRQLIYIFYFSFFLKVEIRRSPSNRKRTKYDHRFRSKLSSEVRDSNWPEFFDDFQFKISPINLQYGDKLGLSLYTTNISSPSATIAPFVFFN